MVPGVRSAFLRTVREGVRDRAWEDHVLLLTSVSCLTAEGDEAAAEDLSGISDSSFLKEPFLTQVPFCLASARSSIMVSSKVSMT